MDTNEKHRKTGQAMVEFCIGLLAIIIVIAVTFVVGRMGLARTQARVDATRRASYQAMNSTSGSVFQVPNYLSAVNEGNDGQRYSQDDIQSSGSALTPFQTLVATSRPDELRSYAPGNIFAEMNSLSDLMTTTGLVRGDGSEIVPVDDYPIARRLFINQSSVGFDITAWSVRTGDLY